ncbi:MAG: ABC transporter permease [Acidobacteria bacterium]|nr:ABC transporter permease [Acidobacteriota bacterium]
MSRDRLLGRSSLRHLSRHPWQVALSILGIAVGVAVVVAIELANQSAERAFELSTDQLTGRATHQIIGGPSGVPDDVYVRLRRELGLEDAAPLLEEYAALPDHPDRVLRLVGVDPLAEVAVGRALGGGERQDPAPLLTEAGAALVARSTAEGLGLGLGEPLDILLDGRHGRIHPVGWLEDRPGLEDLVVVDLSSAQELLGKPGRLSRIDLVLPPGARGEEILGRIEGLLPPSTRVVASESQAATTQAMTGSFRLNLRALSLLALLCGTFLVYNTVSFSVLQRRQILGRLRALGVTRHQVLRQVLSEAAVLGLAGTAVGLVLGVVLGHGLVRLVTQTINDLYFVVTVRRLALPPSALAVGVLLGLGASLGAALAPAREATAAPPRDTLSRSALEHRSRARLPRLAVGGVALLALGGLLLVPPRPLWLSFAGMFATILGCGLLTPPATAWMMRGAAALAVRRKGLLARMAARGVVASLSRTGVAMAALTVAVSMSVGVGVMIDSFRDSVVRWLEYTLAADVYVSPIRPGHGGARAPLSPELAARLAALPGVERVNTMRRVEIDTAAGPVRLAVADLDERGRDGFHLVAGSPGAAWTAVSDDDGVLVSEPFAFHRRVGVGDRLELPTDRGPRSFRIAGVYRDYGSDQGVVVLARRTYDKYWRDQGFTALALFAAPATDPEALLPQVRALVGATSDLQVRSNRAIRELSLEIFDRTFLITGVLRLLAGGVAFLGVLGALMTLQLDRARELAVLRANGLTPRQVWRLVTAQTGLMGLAAGLLSIPTGLLMAVIMTYVVNRRSFGWTVDLQLTPSVPLEALGLALAAALLAGIYPAWRMARTPPALALREE